MFPYDTSPSGEDFSCQARKAVPGILYVFPSRMTKLDAKKTVTNVLF